MKYKTYKVFKYSDMPQNIKWAVDGLIGSRIGMNHFFQAVCETKSGWVNL
jgi:hypothetical protein